MKYLVFAISLILLSCSSQTKNMISKGQLIVKGGVFKDKQWNDSLVFDRVSWYKEMTLLYDALYTKPVVEGTFANWFSESELKAIRECPDSLIFVTYQLDNKRLSHLMFKDQLKKLGYEEFALENFGNNLRLHPNFEELALGPYKINGYCRKGGVLDADLRVTFPGFQEIKLK
ncbi:MAG: hypothetical protein Fur0010_10530 [Bdellovibrio sp.]